MRALRGRTTEKRSALSQRARIAREEDPTTITTKRADEGWSLARSFARKGGLVFVLSHLHTSPRLVRVSPPSSSSFRTRNNRRGCVTHSTRASMARGCKKGGGFFLSPSLFLSFFRCLSLCLTFSLSRSFLFSSVLLCRAIINPGISSPNRENRGIPRRSLVAGRVRRTSTPPDEPPYFSSGWFTFLSRLPGVVTSRPSLNSRREPLNNAIMEKEGAYSRR